MCLARATDGKVKLSCEISAKDHIKFQIAYSDMLKLELDGLKKRRVPGPASRRAAPPASTAPAPERRCAALHDPPPPSARSSRLLCAPAGIGREKRSSRAATER